MLLLDVSAVLHMDIFVGFVVKCKKCSDKIGFVFVTTKLSKKVSRFCHPFLSRSKKVRSENVLSIPSAQHIQRNACAQYMIDAPHTIDALGRCVTSKKVPSNFPLKYGCSLGG